MRIAFAIVLAAAACGSAESSSDGPDGAVSLQDLGPTACMFGNGRACDPVIGCPDQNGCNWCACDPRGTAAPNTPVCTLAACVDADGGMRALQACATRADCNAGQTCVYDPGCAPGAMGRCTTASACMYPPINLTVTGSHDICTCGGVTKTINIECGVEEPYRKVGGCD
jgi:hypothetical protein